MTVQLANVPRGEFLAWLDTLDGDMQSDALYARCRHDLGLFAITYFPERFDSPVNALHRDFMARRVEPWHTRREQVLEADAAPRGAAKSTWSSFAEPIRDVLYGLELYQVFLSTTYDLSMDLVKDIYNVFTDRDAFADLHHDFGPFRVTGTRTDFVVHVPGGDPRGCRVKAFSFGGSIRGTKHAGIRPTVVRIDDGEHPERVRSADQRAKTWEFLTKDIMKAGRRYTRVRVVGTVLHMASMLAALLAAPNWKSTKWRAIQQWPERMDLWERCRVQWANLADEHRGDTARAFYDANREEMDRGSSVLWPEELSLWDLLVEFWTDPAAFYSERQNEPRDPTRQIFDVEKFARCSFDGQVIKTAEGRLVDIRSCVVGVALDPVPAESMGGDYAGVVMMARDPLGYRYVLRLVLRRCAPSAQRALVWDLWQQAGGTAAVKVGIEGNGFQRMFGEDFERERRERREAGAVWHMKPQMITNTGNKGDRIAGLEPSTINGWLQFDEALPHDLLEMFRDFPGAAHDDGPDVIAICDTMIADRSFASATAFGR